MQAELIERNTTHSSEDAFPYFLEITLRPDSVQEAMSLAFIASRLREEDIWCVIHEDRLTVSCRWFKGSGNKTT
jgi:hypothetical protein